MSRGGPALRALLADAHGTLIETREPVGETYARLAGEHGVEIPPWRLDDAFRRVVARAGPIAYSADWTSPRARAEDERSWWHARVRETFRAADQTLAFDDFGAFFEAVFAHYAGATAWRACPGARESLERARALGLATGVVSNFDHRLPQILQAIGIDAFLDFVAIPSQGHRPKPSTEGLEAALAALACPAEAALYTGDDAPGTLEAFRALGVRVCSVAELGGDLRGLPERLDAIATLPDEP